MITIIAGTNRKNSVTLKVARYYEKLLKQRGENCQVLDLAKLPKDFVFSSLYGQENLDFVQITEQFIFTPSKLIVVTPEYNGSFPGIMKSFIDGWNPKKVSGKWVALVGVSSGRQKLRWVPQANFDGHAFSVHYVLFVLCVIKN